MKSWNRGLTKYDDPRIMASSIRMIGDNNAGVKLRKNSDRYKSYCANLSEKMKEKILNGTFTPNTNNRLTHFDITRNGIKYRSSWEYIFHILNPQYEYESLRIKYINSDGIDKIHIVDFVDHYLKRVIEVKPKELFDKSDNVDKRLCLLDWCEQNKYSYFQFTQDDILANSKKINEILHTNKDYEIIKKVRKYLK